MTCASERASVRFWMAFNWGSFAWGIRKKIPAGWGGRLGNMRAIEARIQVRKDNTDLLILLGPTAYAYYTARTYVVK